MNEQYKDLVSLLLPEGILRYFSLTQVFQGKDGQVHLYLEEQNIAPEEHKGRLLHSKGFLPSIEVQDFPLRGPRGRRQGAGARGEDGRRGPAQRVARGTGREGFGDLEEDGRGMTGATCSIT